MQTLLTLAFFLAVAGGIFAFSFAIWRRLVDDYTTDQIFYLILLLLLGGGGGFLLASFFATAAASWGFFAGLGALGAYAIKRLDLGIFEVIDSVVIGLLWLVLSVWVGTLAKDGFGDYYLVVGEIVLAVVAIFSYGFFSRRYRRLSWYPSGKIGFVGLATSAVYFLIRFMLAMVSALVLSLPGRLAEAVVSLIIFTILVIFIWLRSGRGETEKINLYFRKRR